MSKAFWKDDGAGRILAGREEKLVSEICIYYRELITVPFTKEGVGAINLPMGD